MKPEYARFSTILALVCACLTSTSVWSLTQAELQAALDDARMHLELPGLRAAIARPGEKLLLAASGYANVETATPLDNHIGMPGGSTGKLFAATATLRLVEEGTLTLNDPVSNWLANAPWFADLPNRHTMQVQHLLAHSSGLGDYPQTARFNLTMVWRVLRRGSAYFAPEELIAFAGRKAAFAPGEGYHYTDAGYLVLGRVIERASGRDYYTLLEEQILRPLALHDIHPQNRAALPDIATGYSHGTSVLRPDGRMKFDPRSEWTGGGLVTTPAMLARFVDALAARRIVQAETVQQMLRAGWRGGPRSERVRYGLGVFVWDNGASWGHEGMWPGYRSVVVHYPAQGHTVALQTNRDGHVDLRGLAAQLAERASVSR